MNKKRKLLFWSFTALLGISTTITSIAISASKSIATLNLTATNTYSINNKSASKLEIGNQSLNEQTFSGLPGSLQVYINGSEHNPNDYQYTWKVNKNDGNDWQVYNTIVGKNTIQIESKITNELIDWTFRCEVQQLSTKEKVTSQDIKFSFLPIEGSYINVNIQPIAKITAESDTKVTLTTNASIVGSKYSNKSIGYQWFRYDSTKNSFTKIENANQSTYEFKTQKYAETTIEKYVCRYYFTDNPEVYLNESNQSIITINPFKQEKISITSLEATPNIIKSGEKTTLSVKATSTHTDNLTYQWYLANNKTYEFQIIEGATSSTYEYTAEAVTEDTNLIFMVMVKGTQYYLQSDNLNVKVVPSSYIIETPTNNLEVTSTVYTNQAAVKSDFYPWARVDRWWYKVEVKNNNSTSNLTYQWYYVGHNGKEHLIDGATENTLTPTKDLFKAIYNDNSNHRAQIMCKIYNNGKLAKIIDQKTNHRFYMTVGIMNRKIKLLK